MNLTILEWVEIFGMIVLPITGYVIALILRGLRTKLSDMSAAHTELTKEVADLRKENASWRVEIAKEFALKKDLESALQQVNDSVHRVEEKLDRLLMLGLSPRS